LWTNERDRNTENKDGGCPVLVGVRVAICAVIAREWHLIRRALCCFQAVADDLSHLQIQSSMQDVMMLYPQCKKASCHFHFAVNYFSTHVQGM
jgi:hypothetical protein